MTEHPNIAAGHWLVKEGKRIGREYTSAGRPRTAPRHKKGGEHE